MNNYKENLCRYLSSMTHAEILLKSGVISDKEYALIDTILAKKYGVNSCNIYRGIDLIYTETRGKMVSKVVV